MCFLPECLVLQGKLKHAKYRRTTKWLRLEGTFRGHLVQPHCSSQVTYSRLPRTRYILNIYKNGESITSVNNLCQGLVTLMVKKCFWSRDNLLCVSAGAHCLLPCHQASLKTAWLHFLCTFPSGISLLPSDPLSLLFSKLHITRSFSFFSQEICFHSFNFMACNMGQTFCFVFLV